MRKEEGYAIGIAPGFSLFSLCMEVGIRELTLYGFTQDNTKRPSAQRKAFQKACVDAVQLLRNEDASLLVVGNSTSPMFPSELLPFVGKRAEFGAASIRVNFLVNYSWLWDLNQASTPFDYGKENGSFLETIGSRDISRIDLIIRWGGRRRLSGFLPVQSVYADFYVVDEYWPDFKPEHFFGALRWYEAQDITLGG
jgi:undecaprenyl diphosphate synthase